MKTEDLQNEIKVIRKTLSWMDMVMANLSESVFVVNKQWKIIFVNDALADLIGQMRIILLGKDIWDILPLTKDGESIKSKIYEDKMSITDIQALNGVYKLESHKISWLLELRCSYIPSLEQAVCLLSDITIETRAVEQLHKLAERK